MPSSGSQYEAILGSKNIGSLLKKGADNLAKGATKARKIQGQYKTARYSEIRQPIREKKARYEATMGRQKESLKARTEAEELKTFQEKKAARPASANIRRKIKRLESGYGTIQPASSSTSAAQMRGNASSNNTL